MSFDFSTLKACDHVVHDEEVLLNKDKQTIVIKNAPKNGLLTINVNGTFVPQTGTFTLPKITFKKGPYNFPPNVRENTSITPATGSRDLNTGYTSYVLGINYLNEKYLVNMPIGINISAETLASHISNQIKNLTNLLVSTNNGCLVFTFNSVYLSSPFGIYDYKADDKTTSLPLSRSMAYVYKQLGLPDSARFQAVSSPVYPGWSISRTNGELIVKFNKMLSEENPNIKITYATDPKTCPLCQGASTIHDYVYNDGSYQTVSDIDLLMQEFDRYLSTQASSHFKWTWYGSNLYDLIGTKITSEQTASLAAKSAVESTFNNYRSIKTQQQRAYNQNVTDKEFPLSLVDVVTTFPDNDPNTMVVDVSIQSRSGLIVSLTKTITQNPFFVSSQNPLSGSNS